MTDRVAGAIALVRLHNKKRRLTDAESETLEVIGHSRSATTLIATRRPRGGRPEGWSQQMRGTRCAGTSRRATGPRRPQQPHLRRYVPASSAALARRSSETTPA